MAAPMLSWRRQWKGDLATAIWQTFQINKCKYLMKCHVTDDTYKVLLYDMDSMWYEKCTKNKLRKICKELNPSIEAPVTRILDHVKHCLTSQQSDVKYKISKDENTLTLSFHSDLADGVPFIWQCQCCLATDDMRSNNFTLPLLTMVSELLRRQQELETLLQKKDSEIEDYKLGGAKVSRKHLETVPFVKKAFLNEMNMSKGFESQVSCQGSSAFNEKGQDLYQNVMMKNAWLKRDKTQDIGEEEDTNTQSASIQRLPPSYIKDQPSPSTSPRKPSPRKQSPLKSSPDTSPVKDTELLRRQALEKRLAAEESKLATKKKKQKKGLF